MFIKFELTLTGQQESEILMVGDLQPTAQFHSHTEESHRYLFRDDLHLKYIELFITYSLAFEAEIQDGQAHPAIWKLSKFPSSIMYILGCGRTPADFRFFHLCLHSLEIVYSAFILC